VCLDCFNIKTLSWHVYNSNLNIGSFDFILILAQIINNFSKVQQNENLFNLCRNGKGITIYIGTLGKPYGINCIGVGYMQHN